MYQVVLVFSLVIWAFVIAIIISSPSDVRRTVRLLRRTGGKPTPPSPSFPRSPMAGANAAARTATRSRAPERRVGAKLAAPSREP